MPKTIADLQREKRSQILAPAQAAIDLAEAEARDLTPEESEVVTRAAADAAPITAVIQATEQVRSASAPASGLPTTNIRVGREPMTYQRGDRRTSYFKDLGMAMVGNDPEARNRLGQHRTEMAVELPKMEARYAEAEFQARLDEFRDGDRNASFNRRDITRTDGAGGEFVPPLWIMEEYAELARAGRVTAGLIRNIPLPGGTDSISIPRITGGTAVAAQTADNAAVSETDITTSSATGPVRTLAGQQDIALQLLEQSPLVFDEIVFADLTADYNSKLDTQVLNGSGANGQHTGFLVQASTNALTYVDASPTVPEMWPSGGQMISQASSGRKMPPTAFVMHSRRWYWMVSSLDSSNRPYVVPAPQGPYNSLAVANGVAAEGPAGYWFGLPVFLDQNMPTALGAGTEDAVITFRGADHLLFEGPLRTRALPEVLSGNLTVRLQVYAYSALILGRYPAGVSKLTGTGLAAPSGF